MKRAVVAVTEQGARVADRLAGPLGADVWLLQSVSGSAPLPGVRNFSKLSDISGEIFASYDAMVFVMALGIVFRTLAPHVHDKHSDPAVVVVDEGTGFAISALSGHEGGANDLAVLVSSVLGSEPVVTTASESTKKLFVGVGCRKGAAAPDIVAAVRSALGKAGRSINEVRWLATINEKREEPGLIAAAGELGVALRFFPGWRVNDSQLRFETSATAAKYLGVQAVSEPCSLMCSPRSRLLVGKTIFDGVTVAVAEDGGPHSGPENGAIENGK